MPSWRQPYNLGTWTWSYNLNLIGQDKLPTGKIRTELPVKAYEHHVQLRSWTWNYNLNLIGKDFFPPGKRSTELTVKPYEYSVQLRTWIGLPPPPLPPVPFNQYDWPLSFGPQQPERTTTASYNLSLIGKDIVPGKKALDLPIPPDYPVQLRQWFSKLPPPVVVEALPVGNVSTALPEQPDYPVSLRSWLTTPAVPPVVVVSYMPARVLEWGTPLEAQRLLPDWTFPIRTWR